MSHHDDGAPVGAQYATILVVFELSKAKWKLGVLLPGSQKLNRYTVDGGDTAAVAALLTKARGQVTDPVRIVSGPAAKPWEGEGFRPRRLSLCCAPSPGATGLDCPPSSPSACRSPSHRGRR